MKSRNAVYVRVLLVVISIVVLLVFFNRSPQRVQHDAWLPSSFNPVGAGTMALYETLHDSHWPVERWRDPLSRLSAYGAGNALIITRSRVGGRVNFTGQEAQLLDAWVTQGNTLLLFGEMNQAADSRLLLEQFGFTLPEMTNGVTHFLQDFDAHPKGELAIAPSAGNSGTLVLPPHTDALPIGYPPGSTLRWEAGGQPFIVDLPRGKGRVIFAASARMLDGRYLGLGDNLAIILQLLAPGGAVPRHLFFEESHHGYSAVYALSHLLDDPGVRFAGMLTLLGALAFFGSSLVRFGPVVPLNREAGRSTLEFVDSIADLYQRADVRNDTMKYLFTETHQRVLQRLNLPPTVSHEIIAARLKQAHPNLPKWKKLAQRFDSRDYVEGLPPGGWLRVARELIEIRSAMA